jgi:hypothetical protein
LLVGVLVYLMLFDPVGMTGNAVFLHLSASVPAFAAAAVSHLLLTRFILIPAGKGGYT